MDEERALNDRGRAPIRASGGWDAQEPSTRASNRLVSKRRDDFSAKVGTLDEFGVNSNAKRKRDMGFSSQPRKNSSVKIIQL